MAAHSAQYDILLTERILHSLHQNRIGYIWPVLTPINKIGWLFLSQMIYPGYIFIFSLVLYWLVSKGVLILSKVFVCVVQIFNFFIFIRIYLGSAAKIPQRK